MNSLLLAETINTASPSLWKIAEQVPALVVLVVLVSWFLKHLKEEREFQRGLAESHENLIKNMDTTIRETSVSLGKSINVIERMERKLENK